MVRQRAIIAVVLAALLLAASMPAIAADIDAAWELLEISGAVDQVRMSVDELKLPFETQDADFPEGALQVILGLIDAYFDPEAALADMAEALNEALTDDDAAALLDWHRSELGARLTAAEIQGTSSREFEQSLADALPLLDDPQRLQFAHELHQLAGGGEYVVKTFENFTLAGIYLAAIAADPDEAIPFDEIRTEIAGQRDQFAAAAVQLSILSGIVTYRDFSMEELHQYKAFLETEAARKMSDVITQGIVNMAERFVSNLEGRWAAATAANGGADPIRRTLALSGAEAQLHEYPQVIKDSITQGAMSAGLPDEALQAMFELVDAYFDPEAILATIADELNAGLTDDDAAELLQWYASELGARITAVEIEATSADLLERAFAEAQPLLADEDRVKYAQALYVLSDGGSDYLFDVYANTFLASTLLFHIALNPGEPLDLDAFRSQMALERPSIAAFLEQTGVISSVWTYRDFTIEEQDAYKTFLETPAARKFTDAVTRNLVAAGEQFVASLEEHAASLVAPSAE